ncbi:MAG TPA: four helix bundle protein [Fimbriimonadaceae bacterium]|nr:four helix bundle protein [Fimbriimonadaceae bacterium]
MAASKASFRDLEIWKSGIDLMVRVYALTAGLPATERFNLTAQLNRSALSVPTNIAEGWGRGLGGNQVQFIKIARGSLYEVLFLLEATKALNLAPPTQIVTLSERLRGLGKAPQCLS